MHLPGALSFWFLIEPFAPFECHGLQCAVPKMQDMQIQSLCLSLTNFSVEIPLFSQSDHLQKRKMILVMHTHEFLLVIILAKCSTDTGIVLMSGVSMGDNRVPLTRIACHFYSVLCAEVSHPKTECQGS